MQHTIVPCAANRRGGSRGRVPAVFLALAALAGCSDSRDRSPTSPTPGPGENVHYTALGASDTIGFGSSASCMPFVACPDGRGYVQIIERELRKSRQVTLSNLGIPGSVLSPRIQAIGNAHNRGIPANLIERQLPFVPRASTLVTVFIGGNDTNTTAAALEAGAGGGNPDGYIREQIGQFGTEYQQLVEGIRQRAPDARIIIANLPNFAGLPFTSRYSQVRRRAMQRISVGFSRRASDLAARGVTVVDLLCDPRSYQAAHYSSDGFHPNDTGYAFLAAEILEAVHTAAYPAPAGSCAQMRLVPE